MYNNYDYIYIYYMHICLERMNDEIWMNLKFFSFINKGT